LKALSPLKSLLPLIKQSYDAITALSSSSTVTISRVLSTALKLYESGISLTKHDSATVAEFASTFSKEIDKRFFFKELPFLLEAGEFLDPFIFQDHLPADCDDREAVEKKQADLRRVREKIIAAVGCAELQEDSVAVGIFGDETPGTDIAVVGFKDQLTAYARAVRSSGRVGDSLAWWRCHAAEFPLVGRLARSVLAAQASSSECERLFSAAA
jgi:hypothetical protein